MENDPYDYGVWVTYLHLPSAVHSLTDSIDLASPRCSAVNVREHSIGRTTCPPPSIVKVRE